MKTNKKSKDELICLKIGSKAKIIEYFEHKNISYAKIRINMKFENSSFQVLKTVDIENIKKEFNYN